MDGVLLTKYMPSENLKSPQLTCKGRDMAKLCDTNTRSLVYSRCAKITRHFAHC